MSYVEKQLLVCESCDQLDGEDDGSLSSSFVKLNKATVQHTCQPQNRHYRQGWVHEGETGVTVEHEF